jgi:methylenetetrahydrofolate dehydrogenase (NADP+)/methenyltetrahydrofolate cyclohydrolase
MPARLLEGRPVSARIGEEVRIRASALRQAGIAPAAVVFVGSGDAAGMLYAQSIARRGKNSAIDVRIVTLDAAHPDAALNAVREQGRDPATHGVLIQRPLPKPLDFQDFVEAIPPEKDVDAAHPYSLGLLVAGRPRFVPATATAVMEILAAMPFDLSGKRVAVIGRSLVVGRPLALVLLSADATVTISHSRTRDLREHTRAADVVVAAVGKPRFVTADMVRPGAVVIDVGTNVVGERIVGDVDSSVADVAGALTPVPGGVGPVTTAVFLRSVVGAAESISKLS